MNFRWAIVVGLVLAGALGWWAWQQGVAHRRVPVIVYVVDTLRADRVWLSGDLRSSTPNIAAMATESVVFTQAYAPAPWTLPSVASLLTSTFVCEHGLTDERQRLNPGLKTLAQRLKDKEYLTGAYYGNVFVGPVSGLERGYDVFVERLAINEMVAANERADDLGNFIDLAGSRPFFLYLHTMEPHDPAWTPYDFIKPFGFVQVDTRQRYDRLVRRLGALRTVDWFAKQPAGFTDNAAEQQRVLAELSALQDPIDRLYRASVSWADRNLGAVVAELKRAGLWNQAIFVFTSDHGDELGDHAEWTHGQSVYEELIRVPMIIHFPDNAFAGRRIDSVVSLVDLVPTILDWLGDPDACSNCRGISLLPLLDDDTKPVQEARVPSMRINRRAFYRPWSDERGSLNVVVRDGAAKGIWNADIQSVELYDLQVDPEEQQDRAALESAHAQEMFATARQWLENCEQNVKRAETQQDIGRENEEKLRALGYLQ